MLSCRSSCGSTDPPLVACLLSRSGRNPGIVPGAGADRAAGSAGASGGGGRRRVLAPLASDVRRRRARPAPVARARRAGRVVRPRDLSVHPRPAHISRDSSVARSVSEAEDAARRAPVRRSGACAPAPVWPCLPRGAAVQPDVGGLREVAVGGGARQGRCRAWLVGGAHVRGDKGGDGAADAAWGQTGLRVARHLVDRSSAVELVLACTGRFRIPEPIRLAHHATTALRRAHDADALPVAERDYPWFVRKTHSED